MLGSNATGRHRHSHGHGDIRGQKQMEGSPLSTCSHCMCPLSSQPRSLRKHVARRGSSISHGIYYPHGIQVVSTNRGLTHGTYGGELNLFYGVGSPPWFHP